MPPGPEPAFVSLAHTPPASDAELLDRARAFYSQMATYRTTRHFATPPSPARRSNSPSAPPAPRRAGRTSSRGPSPNPMGFLGELLGRPEREKAFRGVPIGHPAADARVPDLRRRTLEEISVFY